MNLLVGNRIWPIRVTRPNKPILTLKPTIMSIIQFYLYNFICACAFAFAGLVSTGFTQSQSGRGYVNVSDKLLKYISTNKTVSWKLAFDVDDYSRGVTLRSSSDIEYYLVIHANGQYQEIEGDQVLEGKWEILKEEEKIVFSCSLANGIPLKGEIIPTEFDLAEFSKEELILAWQGRHGEVKKVYRPVR